MPPVAIVTSTIKAALQAVASASNPTALLQEKNEKTVPLASTVLHLKTLADQVEKPGNAAARAWKACVEQQGLLALLAAAISNSLCALDAAALCETLEVQPGEQQSDPETLSPKQMAVGSVVMLISTLSDSITAYDKATPMPSKPTHVKPLPGAAVAAMKSCGLISGLAALCDRISAVLQADRCKHQQRRQQQQPGRQAANQLPIDTSAELAAATVLQLAYDLAHHWPSNLLNSTDTHPFQPLLQGSMRLAVSVLASHQAAAAEAAAALRAGSSSSRGVNHISLAEVAETMTISKSLMNAGFAAVALANQMCAAFSLLPNTMEAAAAAGRGDVDLNDTVILAAAAASTHACALHEQLHGLSPLVSCADVTAALGPAGGSPSGSGGGSGRSGGNGGSAGSSRSARAKHPAAQQRKQPQPQQQAQPSQLVVPPLHEDMFLVLGIPWAAAAWRNYGMYLTREDAACITTHTLAECLTHRSVLWQEDHSSSSAATDDAPFPIPTELYLPVMRLLMEVPLLLTGEGFSRLLFINLSAVQGVQSWRESTTDEAMVASAQPSGGPSGPDLRLALRSPNSTLRPHLLLMAPAVLKFLDDTAAAQAAGLTADDPLFRRRVNLLSCLSYPAMSFMKDATSDAEPAALADLAAILSEMPLTITRALQACIRAMVCRLPVLASAQAGETMQSATRDRFQQINSMQQAELARREAHWASHQSVKVCYYAEPLIATLHFALLSSQQFTAAVRKLAAQQPLAAVAQFLQQLKEQLYAVLSTCIKCVVVGSSNNQSGVLGPCLLRSTQLMAAVTLGILQKHHTTLGCAAAAAAGISASSTSSSSTASQKQGKQTQGQHAMSSQKKGSSGSTTGSPGGVKPLLEAGPAPWLGLVGRASMAAGQLLRRLTATMPADELDDIICDNTAPRHALLEELPRTLAALREQLVQQQLGSAQHAYVQDSSDDTGADVARDQQGPMAGHAAAAATAAATAAAAAAQMQELALQAADHLDAYCMVAGSGNVEHLSQLADVLCSLGAEMNSAFPSRAGCNNPGCTNLQQMSEVMLVAGRLCSGCRAAAYCGKACQSSHWKQHKATCKQLQRQAGTSKP